MIKLLLFAAIACYLFKLVSGRWPWEAKVPAQARAVSQARRLLGVTPSAPREDIIVAHRRLVTLVHPDRGGSNAQVHEANAARDLLLAALPDHS